MKRARKETEAISSMVERIAHKYLGPNAPEAIMHFQHEVLSGSVLDHIGKDGDAALFVEGWFAGYNIGVMRTHMLRFMNPAPPAETKRPARGSRR